MTTELIVGALGQVLFTCTNGAGVATVPSVATVACVDELGATVAGLTATIGLAGLVTVAVPARATVGALTVTLSATVSGSPVTLTECCEVAAGYWFTLAELRDEFTELAGAAWPDAKLIRARRRAVQRCEEILGYAGVERYAEHTAVVRGETVQLPHAFVRSVRKASVTDDLVALVLDPTLIEVYPRAVGSCWFDGVLTVGYTHGVPVLDEKLREAAMELTANRLFNRKSSVSPRTTSWTSSEGNTYRNDTAGRMKTGYPDIDAVLWDASLAIGIA